MASVQELYPTLKISLCDQKGSGFFREDTIGTPNPIEKTCPGSFFLPTRGGESIRYVSIDENRKRKVIPREDALRMLQNKEAGHENIIPEKYEVAYIKGCPEISVQWQKENNWQPSVDPHSDVIMIEDGYAEFEYSNDPVKYRYVLELMWNRDLPHRIEKVQPMYYVVKEAEAKHESVEFIFDKADALAEWQKLVIKGTGGKPNTYNEEKINAYCGLLGVSGSNTAGKLLSLHEKLLADPSGFVTKIKAYSEEVITDISHALDLKLLKFEGNNAIFFDNGSGNAKSIELPGTGSKGSKMEKLGVILRSAEFKELYVMLKNQIQLSKEKNLN